MASSPQAPAQGQGAGNPAPDSDVDKDYAAQADAGDTSFAGKENKVADQQSATPKAVDMPQTATPAGGQPQKGTGLDSPGTDDPDQADAGDTSFDPGKDAGSTT